MANPWDQDEIIQPTKSDGMIDTVTSAPAVSGGAAEPWSQDAIQQTPAGADPASYVPHMQALFDAGASADDLRKYAQSQGLDPNGFTNLERGIEYRDNGGKGAKIGFPEGYQAQAGEPPQQPVSTELPAPQSAGDYLAYGTRKAFQGIAGGLDAINALPQHVADAFFNSIGLPQLFEKLGIPYDNSTQSGRDQIKAVFDRMSTPDQESVSGSAIEGAAGMLPYAGVAAPGAAVASGAGSGAAAEVVKEAGGGPLAQLAASLVGGGAVAAMAGGASRLPGLLPRNRVPNELAQAAERIGVDLLPADAGGPTTRRLSSAAVQAPLSASPLITAGQRVVEQAKNARDRVASAFGAIMNPEAAGESLRSGAMATIKNTGKQGGRFYDKAAALAGDARVDLTKAKQVLDEQIAQLREVPGGGQGLADAETLRSKLNRDGGFSVQGVRDMRTEMFVAPELRGGPVDRRMRQIVNAAAQDIEDGLRAQGKGDAADAFKAADAYWKDRLDLIDNVLKPILGKADTKSGEEIFKSIEQATKGNAKRLNRVLKALPEEESGIVRASLIGRLGRARDSAQNEAGDAFSLETFLSNWSALSLRSKNILFGSEYRATMDDLAKVAAASRKAGEYANKSNTAGGIAGQIAITGAAGLGGIQTLGTSLAAQYGAGKLLASPRFARWLASAAKKPNPTAFRQQIGRLTAIAAAEPHIANDVLALQERLASAFSSTPVRAAAEEKDDRRPEPVR